MSAYSRGNAYEVRAMEAFIIDGYHVWQARGSKGAADLIAVKPGQIVLVQVKGAAKPIGHDGWNGLLALARLVDAVPVVADWPDWRRADAGPMRLRRITAAHRKHSPEWIAEPFVLDEAAAQA
jgi:hypothetical protein